jgi:transcriptional regulator with PAS, ATPase and Fis domain
MPITSLLWIGPARSFPADLAEDPRLDVLWEDRCPERSPGCDLVVLDAASDGARRWLAARTSSDPPIAVWTPDPDPVWLERGARAVLPSGDGAARLVDQLIGLCRQREGSDSPLPQKAAFLARSDPMRSVEALARRAAASRATVLVLGETGTGKEVVARAIHGASPRSSRPFVAINCAALPDTLLETELFGHARGAFTGADRERRGAFEEADTGTLFLDEVGETSGAFQAKLLRVLQERALRPLGAARSRNVDVRVIAATHRDLLREVAHGRFREDLYYRLHVFPIRIPPLRERREDIIPLALHFLALHGDAEGKPSCTLGPDARRRLRAHSWPGNVRELENEVLRALVLARPEESLGANHFSDPRAAEPPPPEVEALDGSANTPLIESLARVEAWLIRDALERHDGRRAATARTLGITREGLYKKMKRFGID